MLGTVMTEAVCISIGARCTMPLLMVTSGSFAQQAMRGADAVVERSATKYDRGDLMLLSPEVREMHESLRQRGILGGGVIGWTEYDFSVPCAGWNELLFVGNGTEDGRYEIDRKEIFSGSLSMENKVAEPQGEHTATFKVCNCWLEAGFHVFRYSRLYWGGYPAFHSWSLLAASGPDGWGTLRVTSAHTVVRVGEKVAVEFTSSGIDRAVKYDLFLKPLCGGEPVRLREVSFPASAAPVTKEIEVICPREGVFELRGRCDGQKLRPSDLGNINLVAINTQNPPPPAKKLSKRLIYDIDCTKPWEKGYWEINETRIVQSPLGTYRETADKNRSAFTYAIDVLQVQVPYLLEVDYPDDNRRTFLIVELEEIMGENQAGGGVECGDIYRLSHQMQTYPLFFWPRGEKVRVAIVTGNDGMRGAASRIRLYSIEDGLPAGPRGRPDGRTFGYWHEEYERWLSYFGGVDESLANHLITMNRWAQFARFTGANALCPTAMIYQTVSYPSKQMIGSRVRQVDLMRMVLLICEKYGLKFAPDFHPTPSTWFPDKTVLAQFEPAPEPKPYLQYSMEGDPGTASWPRYYGNKPRYMEPRFNPVYPGIQEWYINLFEESVQRWGDSPAFMGISSRLMSWCWLSANSFASLHWGYEDYTVDLFEKETGTKVPVDSDDPARFRKRFEFLTTQAKEQWLKWRCQKILEYHRKLVAVMRNTPAADGRTRPDLQLLLTSHILAQDPAVRAVPAGRFNDWGIDRMGWVTDTPADQMREMGLDPQAYSQEPGIIFFPSFYYGRRYSTPEYDANLRAFLLYSEGLNAIRTHEGQGFLFCNWYFEASMQIPMDGYGLPGVKPHVWGGTADTAGRHYLERFAIAMAERDPCTIWEGGAGYVVGQPEYLNEFTAEYCNLPAVNFDPLPEVRDPVAVWTHRDSDSFYFYAVNRMPYPVKVRLTVDGAGSVTSVSSDKTTKLVGGGLDMELQPYQLRAYKAPPGAKITGCVVNVPAEEKDRLQRTIADAEDLAREIQQGTYGQDARDKLEQFQQRLQTSQQSFDRGHIWRARSSLEHPRMIEIYELCQRYPVGLWERKSRK